MAEPARINAVDQGVSTVKLAAFSATAAGALTLEHFALKELGLPPAKTEGRLEAVSLLLPGLLRAAKVTVPMAAAVSLPTQGVFLRHVKLPQAELPQMHEMISVEALQNVPFPISTAALDYAFTPQTKGSDGSEGMIAAIKRQVMERESKGLKEAGIAPGVVTVAAVALYNAYRYNYEIHKECVLLVNIGAASTGLLFIEGQSLYTSHIPQAGHFITQVIAKELRESFPVAEELKRTKGTVNLGANYANPEDFQMARISQSIRLSLNRIANEITKAILLYRDRRDGSAPVRILLTGGTARLPYIDVFFNKKMDLPVEFFNPLRNVSVGERVDMKQLARDHFCLGELVGLAARETGDSPLPIALNAALLEREEKAKRVVATKPQPARKSLKAAKMKQVKAAPRPALKPAVPVNPALLYGALGAFALLCALPMINNWSQARIIGQMVSAEERRLEQFATYKESLQKKMDEEAQLKDQLAALQRLQAQRDGWYAILQAVNQSLPKGMWITAFNPAFKAAADSAPINQIQVRALYFPGDKSQAFNRQAIDQFVRNLSQTPYFDLDASRVSDALVGEPGSGNGQLAMDFQLRLKLKKPLNPQP
jgi:type IV pilus assembly protein PilM